MSEQVKVAQTVMLRGAGVCGHNAGVAPAAPVASLEEYFDHLFHRHSALETPAWRGPQQAHIGGSIKKDRK
jgi:hypothetical protein